MASTITAAQQRKIENFLRDRHIPEGMGDKEAACSIASINLALFGKLTDNIPECMSPAVGKWIIQVQDEMPDEIRNSLEWRALLPFAAGTGRDPEHEAVRKRMVSNWESHKHEYFDNEYDEYDWNALDPVATLNAMIDVSAAAEPKKRARKKAQVCPNCVAA